MAWSAILAHEGAIGVRNGCFCSHPYVLHLLGVGREGYRHFRDEVLAGTKAHVPGMVRVSFGLYNTRADVDVLIEMLHRITRGEYDNTTPM